MATVAAGKVHGIAPNAHLHLLKMKGDYNKGPRNGRPMDDSTYAVQPKALNKVLNEVRRHVSNNLARNSNAKSVVNMSWGISILTSHIIQCRLTIERSAIQSYQ